MPPELRALYTWRNGAAGYSWEDRCVGVSPWLFLPLEELVSYGAKWRHLAAQSQDDAGRWAAYRPALAKPGVRSALVLDCHPSPHGPTEVLHYDVERSFARTPRMKSLAAVLETWLTWFDLGYVAWADGEWQRSDQLHWTTYRAAFA